MSLFKHTFAQWNSLPPEGNETKGNRIWERITRTLRWRKNRKSFFIAGATATAVAATLLIGYFVGMNALPASPAEQAEHFVRELSAAGNTNLLPDGSKVWLEEGSSLHFDESFLADRKVTLEGSASFDVVKDEAGSTFEVQLGEASVIVHGTSFSISQRFPEEVVVTLYEGAVDFSDGTRTIALAPGRTLTWNRKSSSVTTQVFFSNIHFREGDFKLEDVSLSTLADFIRWRYAVEVYISPKVQQDRIKLTGMVGHDESVDSVFDKVCYVMGLRCSREGMVYRLY